MVSIKLTVRGAKARAEVDGILTSGSVGIPVTIQYDSTWDGLRKALVCTSGKWGPTGDPRTILDIDAAATVAHEVMIAENHLYIGVEGRNADGNIVIHTVWADCGMIFPGANASADPSANPTLPVWAQLGQQIDEVKKGGSDGLTVQLKAALVNYYTHVMPNFDDTNGMAHVSAVLTALGAAPRGENGGAGGDSGDDSGETHTHSYTSTVTTAATCSTAGVRTYICVCGDSYTEAIPAAGHSYADGICTVCGAEDPDHQEDETVSYVTPPCTLPTDSIVGGYIGNNGVVTALDNSYIADTFIKVSPGNTYTVDAEAWYADRYLNLMIRYAWYDASAAFISRSNVTLSTSAHSQQITAPATAAYVKIAAGVPQTTDKDGAYILGCIKIQEGTA